MDNHVSRRQFLGKTSLGAAAISAVPAVLSAQSANDTIGVGHIGIGVRGGTLLTQVAGRQMGGGIKGTKVVAVCDVYKGHRDKGVERSMNPDVKVYIDYKELLADPNVDAVVVATPDHWHKQILCDAAKAKKDVYIEKGWTRSIKEAKAMLAAVKENNIVMQLGHQSRELASGIQAAELIKQGVIGPVTMVRTGRFENRPKGAGFWRWYGWYNNYDRPDPKEVIKDVEWDMWLGSAPKIPFHFEHFWHWRCYWPYGTGIAGDLLSHEIDFVHSVLRLGIPDACICSAQNIFMQDGRDVPDTWNTVYKYEKKQCNVTFDCSQNSSFVQPPEFRGKEGMIRFNTIAQSANNFDVYADPQSADYKADFESGKKKPGQAFMQFDPKKTPKQPSHMQDFFNCIRSRKKTKCNEDEAFVEATALVMAMKAYLEKREVRWDPVKEDVV